MNRKRLPSRKSNLDLKRTQLQQICDLNVEEDSKRNYRMANIVVTVGPSSETEESLIEMIENGMNICRFNLSHRTHEYHLKVLNNLRAAIQKTKDKSHSMIATAIDITGPGVRIGKFRDDIPQPIALVENDKLRLTSDRLYKEKGEKDTVYVPHIFVERAEVKNLIFLKDGPLCLEVKEKDATGLNCVVTQRGEMTSRIQCHIPGSTPLNSAELSEKDKTDIKFCVDNEIDIIFVSMTWCPEIITAVKEELGEASSRVMVIAKIENYVGVKRVDEILAVADGIDVERGDLGVDIEPEKVFVAQKMIIARANTFGKPVICAAQMLNSMVSNARPTRAEAGDVANAVLDGADCLMLSEETAVGKNPVGALQTLARICKEAENAMYYANLFKELRLATAFPVSTPHTTAISAVQAAIMCQASAIVVVTNSGRSAKLIARYRPHCIIIAITHSALIARQLNLYRGVHALLYKSEENPDDWHADIDRRINFALKFAFDKEFVAPMETAILVTGYQAGSGFTNTVRSVIVPDSSSSLSLNEGKTSQANLDDSFSGDEDSPVF